MAYGGYEALFVESLDKDYECPICRLALRDPVQTPCGHTYCSTCFHRATTDVQHRRQDEREGQENEHSDEEEEESEDEFEELEVDELDEEEERLCCPICKQMMHPDKVFDDARLKRKVLSLKVHCTNKKLLTSDDESVCNWTGELVYYQNHLGCCDYEIVSCTNDCGDQCQRVKLENHLLHTCVRRTISCSHCKLKMEQRELRTHLTVCPKFPLPCELACGLNIHRENMRQHISKSGECANTVLPCHFKNVGCIVTYKRCEQDEHLGSSVLQHQKMQHDAMTQQQQIMQRMATQLQSVTEQLSRLTTVNVELREKLTQKDNAMRSLQLSVWQVQLTSETPILSTCGHAMVRVNIKEHDWYESPPFHAHKSGYMATMIVYHTDYGSARSRQKKMCVALCLAKSKNDERLEWPFNKCHRITLLDQQTSDVCHREKVIDPMTLDDSLVDYCFNKPGSRDQSAVTDELITRRKQHAMLCVPHAVLYRGNYVKNDTIVIDVQIDD